MIETFKEETFEEFLKGVHCKMYQEVLDDDLSDHFDAWIGDMDAAQCMDWAEMYGRQQFLSGQTNMYNKIK
jgi:type IV secretory pathway TraG/TraD family ATPase VirD4